MDTPLVSVIVPTYNRAHIVIRAVECVLAQTYSNSEVLVVDNASTDDTARLLRERFGGNERVRYIYQKTRGVSAARNAALLAAQGEYIAFLDSDDSWMPWKLALQVACMRRLPDVGLLWTDLNAVDAEGATTAASCMRTSYAAYTVLRDEQIFSHSAMLKDMAPEILEPPGTTRVYWGDVFSAMAIGNLCQPSTVMLTRRCAELTGGFDESVVSGEDHDYHLRASRVGPCGLIDIAATNYCRGTADQLTARPYQVTIAVNHVKTLERVVREDYARINLPAAILRKARAAAQSWAADEMLWNGERAAARRYALRSISILPLRARPWVILALAFLPTRPLTAVRSMYRKVKLLFRMTGT